MEIKLPFDKCYCLHLSEASDRYENLINELDNLGIKDKVEIWWTSKKPINIVIGNNIESLKATFRENDLPYSDLSYSNSSKQQNERRRNKQQQGE